MPHLLFLRPLPRLRPLPLRCLPRRLPRRDPDRLALRPRPRLERRERLDLDRPPLPRGRRLERREGLDLDRLPLPRGRRLERRERLDLLFLERPERGRRDRLRLSRCGASIIKCKTYSLSLGMKIYQNENK